MTRSVISFFIVVAFVLASTVALSAAPRSSNSGTTQMSSQNWVGKTTNDLLIQLGVPYLSIGKGNGGQTVKYIKREYIGRGNPVDLVQQFDVDQNGRITSEQVYHM